MNSPIARCISYKFGIEQQDVLEHPEKYLGPNYKELFNFWVYWDSLSSEQLEAYVDRSWYLVGQTFRGEFNIEAKFFSEVIGICITNNLSNIDCEIIAAHLYLERNIPFTFLPLIFDL